MDLTTDLEVITRLHGEALFRWALQLTGDRGDALDLVQDTYERALRGGAGRIPRERMRGWLFVIARNQFRDRYRARRRHPMVSLDLTALLVEEPDDDDRPWDGIGVDDLRRAVERLTPTLSEVYRLHAFEGMDYAAIAARLDIPSRTVGTRLLRARLKLRELLVQRETLCAPLRRRQKARALPARPAVSMPRAA